MTATADVTQDAGGISFHCNLLAQPASMNIYGKHQVMNALPCIYIARALGMLRTKTMEQPWKKHDNIPL